MAYVDLKQGTQEEWFLDSRCNNHVSGNKDWFADIDESFRHTVKLDNNTRMVVMGKGNVRLHVNGITNVISNVYCVPDLKNNLLSLGQLQGKGLTILIEHGRCRVHHPECGQIMEIKMSSNRMCSVIATLMPRNSTCLQLESTDESHLWHHRFGHFNYNGLKILSSKKMVNGLPFISTPKELCVQCLEGKQRRNSIPKKSRWAHQANFNLCMQLYVGLSNPLQSVTRGTF